MKPFAHLCGMNGCTKVALTGGLCKGHRSVVRSRTSDGRMAPNKLTADDLATARRMRSAFKSYREIAAHLGVDIKTLRTHMKAGS